MILSQGINIEKKSCYATIEPITTVGVIKETRKTNMGWREGESLDRIVKRQVRD